MGIYDTTPDPDRVHCPRRRSELLADLHSLGERQLEEIGLWYGAIPNVVAELVAREGCTADNDIR